MDKQQSCAACGKTPPGKDEIAAIKKFLGKGQIFCLDCLAEITGFERDELGEKIKQLTEERCRFFP